MLLEDSEAFKEFKIKKNPDFPDLKKNTSQDFQDIQAKISYYNV